MKLSILTCLLYALPIACMDTDTQEQTKTEFSEECLNKCGAAFAIGGFLGSWIGGLCIGVPVATALGMCPAATTAVICCTTLGGCIAGSGYGSLIAVTCCMKPGIPIRITRQLGDTTQQQPELNV